MFFPTILFFFEGLPAFVFRAASRRGVMLRPSRRRNRSAAGKPLPERSPYRLRAFLRHEQKDKNITNATVGAIARTLLPRSARVAGEGSAAFLFFPTILFF